jgi:hypothetical protein
MMDIGALARDGRPFKHKRQKQSRRRWCPDGVAAHAPTLIIASLDADPSQGLS